MITRRAGNLIAFGEKRDDFPWGCGGVMMR